MIEANTFSIVGREMTGIRRYAHEILGRSDEILQIDPPERFRDGLKGRVWQQLILPFQLQGLLWSPANLGPVLYSRQVVTVHDTSVFDHPEWFDRHYVAMYHLLMPLLLRRVKHVLTDSEYSKGRITKLFGLPEERVTAIALAADDRFRPLPETQQQQIRQAQGWPERYLLSVGSLEPRKNLRSLFAAWQAWQDRPKDLKLLVAGGAGKVFSSIGFDQVPADVILLGRVADEILPDLYACAEAFIYPSFYEGFGLPPLEAMACGTPVITSNTTSLPEVVGDAALLIDPYLPVSLLQAMQHLTENAWLRSELTARGLERAREFSWEATAAQTVQVLQEAACSR